MIVVPEDSSFLLITQPGHAHLAGEILSLWRAGGLPGTVRQVANLGGALESALARLNRIPHVPSEVPDPLGAALRRMTLTEPTDRPRAAEVVSAWPARTKGWRG